MKTKILLLLGKHNYGDFHRGTSTEYEAFTHALANLGYEAHHLEIWDRSYNRDFLELNNVILREVGKIKPDIILTVPIHYEIWNETLDILKKSFMTTVCWTTDDSWKYRKFSRFIGKHYDFITTTYDYIVPKYRRDGIQNVILTQWAANSKYLTEPKSAIQCDYEVSFIGQAHGNRRFRINELRKIGINVDCFGYGWPNGPIPSEKIPEIINNSVICLNFSNSSGTNQIKARTFEVPAAGGFLLTEYTEGLEKFFEIGKEIIVFSETKDLKDKILFYLKNTEYRDAIAISGHRRTIKEHTYEHRMSRIIQIALESKKNSSEDKVSILECGLEKASVDYLRHNHILHFVRKGLEIPLKLLFGSRRGPRAARRLIYELSLIFQGADTYSSKGIPGRMFPDL